MTEFSLSREELLEVVPAVSDLLNQLDHVNTVSSVPLDYPTRVWRSYMRLWREHDVSGQSLAIAYEPVWAIGTGLVASLDQISEMHNAIKTCVADLGLSAPVLYGGSVKPDNAGDILSLEHVDGALVGGASLNADEFCQIVTAGS